MNAQSWQLLYEKVRTSIPFSHINPPPHIVDLTTKNDNVTWEFVLDWRGGGDLMRGELVADTYISQYLLGPLRWT